MSSTTSHRLEGLVAPRSMAIVGASDRNHYVRRAMSATEAIGFDGTLHLVNRRGTDAFGRSAFASCRDIGEPVDAAYLCVPIEAVQSAAEDAIAAGIRNLVIIASGYAEIGAEGLARETVLAALCRESGTRVLGPNCLGLRNHVARVAIGSIPYVDQPATGRVAIVSASGAVASTLASYGIQQGTSFTHVIATGNEMNVSAADLIDYLVEVPEVRAVAIFLEAVRDAEAFARAAEKARAARKPLVVLKVGVAEATAAVAASHTGAAVGDDKVFNAACERLAVIRVPTMEALVTTAATVAATGPLAQPGVAMVSLSGGACGIASDLAEGAAVNFPRFADKTRAKLRRIVSDFGQVHNPLDITGAAVRDQAMWTPVLETISEDPGVGLTLVNWDVPAVADPVLPETLDRIGEQLASAAKPMLMVGSVGRPVNEHGLAYLERHASSFALPGIAEGLSAVGRLVWWSNRVGASPIARAAPTRTADGARPAGERAALDHLASFGVPVIPQTIAVSRAEAVTAAEVIGGPVALKVLSPDIAHKSDVGGVMLGVSGSVAVGEAYDAIHANVAARAAGSRIEGVLVAPMRTGGLELIVGVARDPVWGLVLAVGLGGIWVEALGDTVLRLLPCSVEDVKKALLSLRAAKLFAGFRGAPAVDLDAVAKAVGRIGEAAFALGPQLAALEVNPLHVRGGQVEALDALILWDA